MLFIEHNVASGVFELISFLNISRMFVKRHVHFC